MLLSLAQLRLPWSPTSVPRLRSGTHSWSGVSAAAGAGEGGVARSCHPPACFSRRRGQGELPRHLYDGPEPTLRRATGTNPQLGACHVIFRLEGAARGAPSHVLHHAAQRSASSFGGTSSQSAGVHSEVGSRCRASFDALIAHGAQSQAHTALVFNLLERSS